MNSRLFALLLILVCFSTFSFATHTKGGYISYQYISGNQYQIEVHFYIDQSSPASQRREILVDYGDGSPMDTIYQQRTQLIYNELSIVTYRTTHTYNSVGLYTIKVSDPNRIGGIDNIDNSNNVPLYLETDLRILSNTTINNNSVLLSMIPVSKCSIGEYFRLNQAAYDPDGDSLSYQLIAVKGLSGNPAPSYFIPSGVLINPLNGSIKWTPNQLGRYALAVEIKEFRNQVLVGRTISDFIVEVNPNVVAKPYLQLITPQLLQDSCGLYKITAKDGDQLQLIFKSTDTIGYQNDFIITYDSTLVHSTLNTSKRVYSDSSFLNINISIDGQDARCRPYPIYVRSNSNDIFVDDIPILLYVQDSTTIGCDSICGFVGIPSNKKNTELKVSVFPNPVSSNQCTWRIENYTDNYMPSIEIYTTQGRLYYHSQFSSKNQISIDKSILPTGLIFYKIKDKTGNVLNSGKLIVN